MSHISEEAIRFPEADITPDLARSTCGNGLASVEKLSGSSSASVILPTSGDDVVLLVLLREGRECSLSASALLSEGLEEEIREGGRLGGVIIIGPVTGGNSGASCPSVGAES